MDPEAISKTLTLPELNDYGQSLIGRMLEYHNHGACLRGPIMAWAGTTQVLGFKLRIIKRWVPERKQWFFARYCPQIISFYPKDIEFIALLNRGDLLVDLGTTGELIVRMRKRSRQFKLVAT